MSIIWLYSIIASSLFNWTRHLFIPPQKQKKLQGLHGGWGGVRHVGTFLVVSGWSMFIVINIFLLFPLITFLILNRELSHMPLHDTTWHIAGQQVLCSPTTVFLNFWKVQPASAVSRHLGGGIRGVKRHPTSDWLCNDTKTHALQDFIMYVCSWEQRWCKIMHDNSFLSASLPSTG